ncbi:MAG: hypothetical protein HOE11_04995, partial [Candidatus Diapherotrites archaeon]|nr:hypothetical protein [Candidatus Diapherotrites archaeon]
IVVNKEDLKKIKVIPVKSLVDVLEVALQKGAKKKKLVSQLKKIIKIERPSLLKNIARKSVA